MHLKRPIVIALLANFALVGAFRFLSPHCSDSSPPAGRPRASIEKSGVQATQSFDATDRRVRPEPSDQPAAAANSRAARRTEQFGRDARSQRPFISASGKNDSPRASTGVQLDPLDMDDSGATTALNESPVAGSIGRTVAARADEDRPISIPLVFLPDHESSMDERQSAIRDQLGHQFHDAVLGPGQDPASPDYRQRWQYAQQQSDALFKAQFGDSAFLQKQLQLLHQSASTGM